MKVLKLVIFILGGSSGGGIGAAVSDTTFQGIPSPSNYILNEYSSASYNSKLQITSNVPVTIQRSEFLIQDHDGEIPKILVTSNCDTSQTTVGSTFTPIITQGSIDINLDNVGSQTEFLQSSSYDVTWKEWRCGFFTADQIDNFPTINQNEIDIGTEPTACLTEEQCNVKRLDMDIATFRVGNYPTAGCFSKNDVAYWSTSSTSIDDMSEVALPGVQERIMCEKKVSNDNTNPPGGSGGGNEEEERACRTELECDMMRQEMNIGSFRVGDYPTSGCFAKNDVAYWSTSCGDMSKPDLPGVQERIMCKEKSSPPPAVGVCETNSNCGGEAAKFCRLENGVCNNNAESNNVVAGVCDLMPEMCAEIYEPVCGCDKKTYSNECSAHSKGQNVATKGECEADGGSGSIEEEQRACLTELECDTKRQKMNMGFRVGNYPTKGCFSKNEVAYWSTGGSIQDKSTAVLPGVQKRIWCGGNMRSSGSSSAHQKTNPWTAQIQQQEMEIANSACSSLGKSLMLSSLLKKAISSQAKPAAPHDEQARSLQSCTYNVELLLSGCNFRGPVEIKVEAPKARVIGSDIDIVDKETIEVTESMVMDGEQYYKSIYNKYTASMSFPNDKVVSVPVSSGNVPSLDEDSCGYFGGRPFVDTSGDSLLASVLPSNECGLMPTSSWLEDTSVIDDEKSVESQPVSAASNATIMYQYEQLGSKWTRNALAEHASVASFAAFSIALMSNGAPSHLVESAMEAGLDEIKHAKISFAIASRLMGKEISPGPLPPSKHEFNNNMTALAMAVAKEGCVDETLSALEAAAEVELIDIVLNSKEDTGTKYDAIDTETLVWIRDEIHIIALDESIHSSLAWKTLDWVCSVSKDVCNAVEQNVLDESQLILAFQHRFGHSNGYTPELLEWMLKAWKSIYTSRDGLERVSVADKPSVLSHLVDNDSSRV